MGAGSLWFCFVSTDPYYSHKIYTGYRLNIKTAKSFNTRKPQGMKVKTESLTGVGVSDAACQKDSTCDSIIGVVLRREIGWGGGRGNLLLILPRCH